MNNLRSETYTEDSRIPDVTFAKHPSEDALRRDFTINSLYYNLNTGEIEDYTGCGLDDLKAGVIRTPLAASRTFVDDPLRVLRAIRFAARFGFQLHPDIPTAWKSDSVRDGLMNKVSRERIGTEVALMMENVHAASAISLLHASGVIDLVLHAPDDERALSLVGIPKKQYVEWKKADVRGALTCSDDLQLVTTLLSKWEKMKIHFSLNRPDIFHFALLMYPTLIISNVSDSKNSALVCRLSMKLSNEKCKAIAVLMDCAQAVRSACGSANSADETAVLLGRLIREKLREYGKDGILFSLVTSADVDPDVILAKWHDIEKILDKYDLLNSHLWKPVVDGSSLQKELNLTPSPKLQQLLLAEYDMMFTGERDPPTIITQLRKLA